MSTTDDLADEIRRILTRAERPLQVREILARSDLADGVQSLAAPLRQLREAGEVAVDQDPATHVRRYRLAEEKPGSRARNRGLAARVRTAAAALQGEFTARDVARAAGLEETRQVSKVLWFLARTGELTRRRTGANRYAYRRAAPNVSPAPASQRQEAPSPADTPDDARRSTRGAQEHAAPPGEGAAGPHGRPRFALFSDGALVIADADGNVIDLRPEDARRLIRFLNACDHAAIFEEAPPCRQ